MSRKFSDQQLFSMRNHIPIATVITKLLQVPAKINCGTLRFRCPLCAQFNTAINDRTNLARCFDCQKNFNPIDMVMAIRKINFVQAVNLLKACQNNPQTKICEHSNQNTSKLPHIPPNSHGLQKSQLTPAAMTKIQTPQPQSKQTDLFSAVTEHIAKLEVAIENLSEQINQFKGIIHKLHSRS